MPIKNHRQRNGKNGPKIQKMQSLINRKIGNHLNRGPQKTIKKFFQHLFKYLKDYLISKREFFKGKTLESLDIFYKPVLLPKDIVPANSANNSKAQHEIKGPIYIGGLRNICMRFFARILQLFLKNHNYANKKI